MPRHLRWDRRTAAARQRVQLRARLCEQHGFTIVEVMVAALVLVVGLGSLLGMLMTADHVIKTTRLRQEETSIARELLEDARGLPYTQLNTAALATALQPTVPQSTVSGTGLVVTRALAPSTGGNYAFNVSLTACSLDSPSDGYGDHTSPPASGGSWCPDVAANGTTDPQPDDYKRVSVTVTPSGQTTPTVQQTILIYQRPVNGPAVSCLSTTSTCPGSNVTITSGNSVTFNVTTTFQASKIQWFVNGNPPPVSQIGNNGDDPYSPSGTNSTFNWVFPTADGNYTITALAYDSNGNSGTRSTIVVTLNRHQVIAPTSLSAGWNDLIHGVDIQWVPSVDQDVLYYHVYHTYNGVTSLVASCSVNATSCIDSSAAAPPAPGSRPTCSNTSTSYTTSNTYWVVGVDTDPTTGQPRESTAKSPTSDANLCDHPPNAPTNLQGTMVNGQLNLSWTAPSPADPDTPWDSIQAWRIYRWAATGTAQYPGSRYQLVGTSTTNPVTSFTESTPDPGGVTQSYCVTAVDTHLDESPCSAVLTK